MVSPAEPVVYHVAGPDGFTETFDAHTVDVLVRMGLIVHEYDGHVMESGGKPYGPLHRFYCEPQSTRAPSADRGTVAR